jgi:hypothetical protein
VTGERDSVLIGVQQFGRRLRWSMEEDS